MKKLITIIAFLTLIRCTAPSTWLVTNPESRTFATVANDITESGVPYDKTVRHPIFELGDSAGYRQGTGALQRPLDGSPAIGKYVVIGVRRPNNSGADFLGAANMSIILDEELCYTGIMATVFLEANNRVVQGLQKGNWAYMELFEFSEPPCFEIVE